MRYELRIMHYALCIMIFCLVLSCGHQGTNGSAVEEKPLCDYESSSDGIRSLQVYDHKDTAKMGSHTFICSIHRAPDDSLEMARTDGNYKKVMGKYANPLVLILDEWLLLKPTASEQRDIFELLHRRRKKSTTIFCSQYEFEEWYDQLGGDASPLADAIIDRIAHDSYRINITSIDEAHDISMREVYGLDKTLRE